MRSQGDKKGIVNGWGILRNGSAAEGGKVITLEVDHALGGSGRFWLVSLCAEWARGAWECGVTGVFFSLALAASSTRRPDLCF